MFILKTDPVVTWPAEIPMPVDGGTVNKITVGIKYKLIDSDQYEALKHSDIELLSEVVSGWDEDAFGTETTADKAPKPFVFNKKNLQTLLKISYVRMGLIQGYWQAQAGLEKN